MISRILAGTDGSAAAAEALAWAADLARALAVELLVVHGFETDPAKLPGGTSFYCKKRSIHCVAKRGNVGHHRAQHSRIPVTTVFSR
jgi:Universal stress protein family